MTQIDTYRTQGRKDGQDSPGGRNVSSDREPQASGEEGRLAPDNELPGKGVSDWLDRVRNAAIRDKKARFTALFHQLKTPMLERSFGALNPKAKAGVDGLTHKQYSENLNEKLADLAERVQSGAYKPFPGRRSYIPKADGRKRPLGVAALEDKIVQQAVAEVVSAVYETDFVDNSYGFRPNRNCHNALDELYMAITTRKVNFVLDADIQGFFDSVDHDWMTKFVEHRIADPRIVRLIKLWLKAGVIEDGNWKETDVGTPQGSVISPLLANIYLHYALDLWVNNYSKTKSRGEIHFVRYADDFVVCFQYADDAFKFKMALKERLEKFKLTLHPEKTRLIEFGRFAASDRRKRGQGKPETFDFLGFTHICSVTRLNRKFKLLRVTIKKRWRDKLVSLKKELLKRNFWRIKDIGLWLRSVVNGYFGYHAIPGNLSTLGMFRGQLAKIWIWTIRRKSQKAKMSWDKFIPIVEKWLPKPTARHQYPDKRYNVRPQC
jgi:group II intron reverse transcriptase/maturase